MADDAAEEPEPKEAEEAEDENIIPSRTKAGIERREREKPELLVAVAEACEFFQMEPSDWQIYRPLRGLGWEAGRHVGTLLKAAALWLPGETGSVGVRCVRLKTNLIGRRGVPLILEGLDPVYATRGPGSATLVELDLAENSLGAPGTRALCEGIVTARYGGLERLDVSGNKCGRDGGKALAELISSPYGVNLNVLLAKDNLMFDDGVGHCVEINQWNGRVQQNFKPLYLGQIEVDSADFWTNRLLSSSSRSTVEESGPNRSITRTLKSG